MGRIDGNPTTPVNHEEQEQDQDQDQEQEECDYELVTDQPQQDSTNYADQYYQQQDDEQKHKFQQSPHQPQAYPPPPHQYDQKPQAYPPPPQGQLPQAFPPHHAYVLQPQPQPQAFQYQPQAGYQPPSHNIVHEMPASSPVPVPMGVPQYPQFNEGWKTGLFDCFDDPSNTLVTACFPCVTFGQIAEIIDNGQTPCGTSGMLYGLIAFFIAMPCLISCTYRTKLRNRYGLIESPAPDWVTHCFCECCALCQEYRELQSRGMDPSIGWQGNVAKNQNLQHQQVATMPPMNQSMMG